MKSNIEYLREFIANNQEAIEFLEAVSDEISDAEDEIKSLKKDISNNEDEISKLEGYLEQDNEIIFEEIDCGIGVIKYIQPDNLKLQMLMDEFKEQHEHSANFSISMF